MSKPYVVYAGSSACDHRRVQQAVLTVIPPIDQWRCEDCGRIVQQNRDEEPYRVRMPDVPR